MPRSLPTLHRYVALAIGVVAVLPIIGVSIIVGGLATARIERDTAARFQSLANRISERLDEGLHERLSDMRSMATMVGGDLSADSQARLRSTLEAVQESIPHYEWIGLTDATGAVLVSTDGLLEGQNVGERPWFRGGSQGPFVGDVHGALLLEKLLGPTDDGSPRRFIDVAAPLRRDDGVPVGVIGGHLSWAWAEMVQRSVLGTAAGRGREALVLSRDGSVILGPEDLLGVQLSLPLVQAAAQGVRRAGLETWPDGEDYLTAVAPSRAFGDNPGLGWTIIVRQEADTALATARAIRWQLAGVGFVTAAIAMGLGLLLTSRVTRPLRLIAAAADRLRQGDTSVHVPHTRAYAEVASLSAALVDLAGRLADGKALAEALDPHSARLDEQACGPGVFDPRVPLRPLRSPEAET